MQVGVPVLLCQGGMPEPIHATAGLLLPNPLKGELLGVEPPKRDPSSCCSTEVLELEDELLIIASTV